MHSLQKSKSRRSCKSNKDAGSARRPFSGRACKRNFYKKMHAEDGNSAVKLLASHQNIDYRYMKDLNQAGNSYSSYSCKSNQDAASASSRFFGRATRRKHRHGQIFFAKKNI